MIPAGAPGDHWTATVEGMRILFLHDNFPAQFGGFGQYLARSGWDVWYGTKRKGVSLAGVNVFYYEPHRSVTQQIHHYAANFERAILNGQGVVRSALALKRKGVAPDIIMAHSGWGPGMFVKDVWPDAKYVGYFEWFYNAVGPDVAFLSDEKPPLDEKLRARARNAPILTDLAQCDAALTPTEFQKRQFPPRFSDLLTVMHDGVDTDYYAPAPGAGLDLPDLRLDPDCETITYVARGMEPYRGFPEFMRALEIVLARRPGAHAVIVGADRVAYGKAPPKGESYKKRALEECDLDWERIHFTGLLTRANYRQVLRASSVHVYLTIPFVLSWSVLEAMSAGCAIVASDVAPVREVAKKGPDALRLVNHEDVQATADAIIKCLEERETASALGAAARNVILQHYSNRDIYPAKAQWLAELAP